MVMPGQGQASKIIESNFAKEIKSWKMKGIASSFPKVFNGLVLKNHAVDRCTSIGRVKNLPYRISLRLHRFGIMGDL
jgi:hypothetical protein